MREAWALAACLLLPLMAGCMSDAPSLAASSDVQPPLVPDPLLEGALDVARLEYDFGPLVHRGAAGTSAYSLHLRGSLHAPTSGEGPFPAVLFQHGRHATCAVGGQEMAPLAVVGILGPAGACPRAAPVIEPVDSYLGYDYIAANLASHGYVVLSVDANGANDLDGLWTTSGTHADAGGEARAEILLQTLDRLAALNASSDGTDAGDLLATRLDMGRVGLMGHSRGGEGVTYALQHNQARAESARHAIRAVFAVAPIDRNAVTAPDVAWATILPYCDGDVSSLSGARIFDDTAATPDAQPKAQLSVLGANHNFYNTVWTGDDAAWLADDPHCGAEAPTTGRMSPEAQRLQGLVHISSFFRLHLGGETAFGPLFDGRAARADAPALASYAPRADAQRALDLAGAAREGFARDASCAPPECESQAYVTGSATRHVLAWTSPASIAIDLGEARDISAFDAFAVRAGVDPSAPENKDATAQDARVVLVDGSGREESALVSDWSRALALPPGGENAWKLVLNDARVPLSAFVGVDLADIDEIRIVFDVTGQGEVHLASPMLVDDG